MHANQSISAHIALYFSHPILRLQETSDFQQEMFPTATEVHWKVLLREIALEQAGHAPRRLGDKSSTADYSDFKGMRIQNDKSILSFGL